MEELIKVENVDLALSLLKNGEILISGKGKKKYFYKLRKGKIYCQGLSSSFLLSFDEFKSLYSETIFFIYDFKDQESVDLKKDEEYYGWDVLSK